MDDEARTQPPGGGPGGTQLAEELEHLFRHAGDDPAVAWLRDLVLRFRQSQLAGGHHGRG